MLRDPDEVYAAINAFARSVNARVLPSFVFLRGQNSDGLKNFTYDRAALAGRDAERGDALLLRNWALCSIRHNLDVPRVARQMRGRLKAKRVRKATRDEALVIIEACVEAWACEKWRREETDDYHRERLPAALQGARRQHDMDMLAVMRARVADGSEVESRWMRTAFLLRCAASGDLRADMLPQDMTWKDDDIEAFYQDLIDAKDPADLIRKISVAIPRLEGRRKWPLREPRRMREEMLGIFPGTGGDPWLEEEITTVPVPSWAALRDDVANLVGPMREAVRRRLEDSAPEGRERGMRTGRFDSRKMMRAHMGALDVFTRRGESAVPSYGMSLLIDVSPSMIQKNDGLKAQGRIFGGLFESQDEAIYEDYRRDVIAGNQKEARRHALRLVNTDPGLAYGSAWQLGYKAAVMMSAALARVEGLDFGIVAFSDHDDIVKPMGAGMRRSDQENLMRAFAAGGGNTIIDGALVQAEKDLRRYERRLVVVLTDGAFRTEGRAPKEQMQSMLDTGTEVLVLGLASDEGKHSTPGGHFVRIDQEDGLAKCIAAALERLLRRPAA